MSGTTLGYLYFNERGVAAAVIAFAAAYAAALVVSLVPMAKALRVVIAGVGIVTLLVLSFVLTDPGLDRLAWSVVALHGIAGLLLGFASVAVVRGMRRSRLHDGSLDQLR